MSIQSTQRPGRGQGIVPQGQTQDTQAQQKTQAKHGFLGRILHAILHPVDTLKGLFSSRSKSPDTFTAEHFEGRPTVVEQKPLEKRQASHTRRPLPETPTSERRPLPDTPTRKHKPLPEIPQGRAATQGVFDPDAHLSTLIGGRPVAQEASTQARTLDFKGVDEKFAALDEPSKAPEKEESKGTAAEAKPSRVSDEDFDALLGRYKDH